MRPITHRRLCGVLGGLLIALVVGLVVVVGTAPFRTPTAMAQLALLALSGVLDLLAATTDRIAWFRLSGGAKVALGLALPVGVVGWTGDGGGLLLAVTAIGGLGLAAIGVDTALFAGEHVYERSLEE